VSIVERDIEDLAIVLDAETVAALILEPVQGEGGVRVLDHGFIREVRALTRERHVALIFDEIQCGMGRTGSLFAYEQTGVEPDMLTVAKPIAGGLPMGAVLVNDHIAATMNAGDHGTTFGGGPFVASVALHVLERVADPSLLTHVKFEGAWMVRASCDRRSDGPGAFHSRRRVHVGYRRRRARGEVVARAREAGLLV
jgi:acetylornithine/N-succinyldiaminopimelate aminotransferase